MRSTQATKSGKRQHDFSVYIRCVPPMLQLAAAFAAAERRPAPLEIVTLEAGASRRLLVAALERRFKLLASVPLMVEYQAVMTRAEHLTASRLSVGDVSVLLDAVATVCTPVRLAFLWRPTLRDPDDDMVLEAAVNGQAHAIGVSLSTSLSLRALCFGAAARQGSARASDADVAQRHQRNKNDRALRPRPHA
jgi:predicted nucleic acid-binding protein